jgi:hypothetical protein
MAESFYILDGTVSLYSGAKWMDTTAGDYLYVPRGGIHSFANNSGAPASMLILFAPGGPRGVLRGAGRDCRQRPGTDPRRVGTAMGAARPVRGNGRRGLSDLAKVEPTDGRVGATDPSAWWIAVAAAI